MLHSSLLFSSLLFSSYILLPELQSSIHVGGSYAKPKSSFTVQGIQQQALDKIPGKLHGCQNYKYVRSEESHVERERDR